MGIEGGLDEVPALQMLSHPSGWTFRPLKRCLRGKDDDFMKGEEICPTQLYLAKSTNL